MSIVLMVRNPGLRDSQNLFTPSLIFLDHAVTQGLDVCVFPRSIIVLWRHSIPSVIALLLFLGFFQAADTSFVNFVACAQAMTTVQDRCLADDECEMLLGVWTCG